MYANAPNQDGFMDSANWTETVQRLRYAAFKLRRQAEALRAAQGEARRRRFRRRSASLDEAELKESVADEMDDAADRLQRVFLPGGR